MFVASQNTGIASVQTLITGVGGIYANFAFWHSTKVKATDTRCPFNLLFVDGHVAFLDVKDNDAWNGVHVYDWRRP
jgi:prepilin-type processing-associated H-X9-DG protein